MNETQMSPNVEMGCRVEERIKLKHARVVKIWYIYKKNDGGLCSKLDARSLVKKKRKSLGILTAQEEVSVVHKPPVKHHNPRSHPWQPIHRRPWAPRPALCALRGTTPAAELFPSPAWRVLFVPVAEKAVRYWEV